MNLKKRLSKANWHDFSLYPTQGEAIYLRVMSDDKEVCQYVRINCFNAVSFEPKKIVKSMKLDSIANKNWSMNWVYVEEAQPQK